MLWPCALSLRRFEYKRIGILHLHSTGITHHKASSTIHAVTILCDEIDLAICHIHVLDHIAYLQMVIGILKDIEILIIILVVIDYGTIDCGHIPFAYYKGTCRICIVNRCNHLN